MSENKNNGPTLNTIDDYGIYMEKTQGSSADDVYWESYMCVEILLAEIAQLKAERDSARAQLLEASETERYLKKQIEQLKAERDAARRLACKWYSLDDARYEHRSLMLEYAKQQGWDCFKEDPTNEP